jgi:hypothetical protein
MTVSNVAFRGVLSGAVIVALAWAGCAQAKQATLEDDEGDSTPTTTTTTTTAHGGAGGATTSAGGSGGTTSAGGSGGATSTGGAGGAVPTDAGPEDAAPDAPVCSESPCKLVEPQCGCPANKACVATQVGTRSCIKAGSVGWGEKCGPVDYCEAGLQCMPKGLTSTCMKLCDSDAQCTAPGGLCVIHLTDKNGNPLPNVTFCSESCDLTNNNGCPVAGTACGVAQEQAGQMRFFTVCSQSGKGTQGASCKTNSDCAPTYGCVTTNGMSQCAKWCNQGNPVCPGGTLCEAVNINGQEIQVGATVYGVCL